MKLAFYIDFRDDYPTLRDAFCRALTNWEKDEEDSDYLAGIKRTAREVLHEWGAQGVVDATQLEHLREALQDARVVLRAECVALIQEKKTRPHEEQTFFDTTIAANRRAQQEIKQGIGCLNRGINLLKTAELVLGEDEQWQP